MADLGGGSMEVVEFADRAVTTLHSLPLGSLRISNGFGLTQRASAEDVEAALNQARENPFRCQDFHLESRRGTGGIGRLHAPVLRSWTSVTGIIR